MIQLLFTVINTLIICNTLFKRIQLPLPSHNLTTTTLIVAGGKTSPSRAASPSIDCALCSTLFSTRVQANRCQTIELLIFPELYRSCIDFPVQCTEPLWIKIRRYWCCSMAQISGISGTLLLLKYIFKIDERHERRPGDLVLHVALALHLGLYQWLFYCWVALDLHSRWERYDFLDPYDTPQFRGHSIQKHSLCTLLSDMTFVIVPRFNMYSCT